MRLQYLTDEGIQYLKGNFAANLPHYIQRESAYFADLLKKQDFLQDTGYDFNSFASNLQVTDDASADDVHNAEVIHRALSDLPYYMAIDEKIWAALLHTYLFDFVCEKKKDLLDENVRDYQNKIYNSFFTYTRHGKRRGTFVNCVASLYWGAEMVYDPSNHDDPYGLLKEIAATGISEHDCHLLVQPHPWSEGDMHRLPQGNPQIAYGAKMECRPPSRRLRHQIPQSHRRTEHARHAVRRRDRAYNRNVLPRIFPEPRAQGRAVVIV